MTRPKSLRIPDGLWADALATAKAEGKTLTEVVVAALEQYVTKRS